MRNPKYQAILSIYGVLDNTIGITSMKAAILPIIKAIVKVLGCGIGNSFDMSKLRFNKIIIATDADVDGSNITSSYSAFLVFHLPELIKAGYLYKAKPPLYLLDAKIAKKLNTRQYLFDKEEYFNLFHELIAKSVDICLDPEVYSTKPLSYKEKLDWLRLNKNYLAELSTLVTKTKALDIVIEQICRIKIMYPNDEQRFKEEIEFVFPQTTYDISNNSLEGSSPKGDYICVLIDEIFLKLAKKFIIIMAANPCFYVGMKTKNVDDEELRQYTIGQLLSLTENRYSLNVTERYKGLGEIEVDLMLQSVLNPLFRKLIRYTMNDYDKAQETFNLLHNRKCPEKRRELIDSLDITYELLDS